MQITNSFDVKLNPTDTYATGLEGNQLGRMTLDKTFHGALDASSQGEMLSVMTGVQGAAGYVAIEQVNGSLAGKKGTFVLQHFGIMQDGEDYLKLEVVPGSGTGELTGLTGTMNIEIKGGQHYYTFDYELADH
ncbi:DUF3224 domain-containing protein [Alteromonas halophila]|uniref:DUF3224 domain-containing protein n=1 Tax=Alteromonas halophila TaxID=516698 RepID=A0A918MWR6_9ALTE|nr:DUF3224 domain-containing protein [Alteromonas halophila]GGW79538.1 hypothetical protein GCM10007391_10410 [Alteromonas halophila]